MSTKIRGNLMLMLTAMIWGISFVAQKSGIELVGPMTFNGIRTLIGGCVLLPVIYVLGRKAKASDQNNQASDGTMDPAVSADPSEHDMASDPRRERKLLIIGGICCGCILMVAGSLQQIGLIYTTAGKSGFITALYVVLVPICGLFMKKKIRPIIWLCVLASATGLYLLCIPADGGFGHINIGDFLTLLCALCFTLHILVIDYFSPKVDGVKMSCIQFFVAGILGIILIPVIDPAFGYELPTLHMLLGVSVPILYSGVLSCGVAYTLQIVAQAKADPAIASMILCLESVFAVLAGMLILKESMSPRETFGCLIMFAAILVSQLPSKEERLQAKEQ